MFDGIPDQFHQFMPSRTSFPLPLCTFPTTTTTTFDPYTSSTHHLNQAIQPNNDLSMHHPLHFHPNLSTSVPSPQITKNKVEEEEEKDQGGNGLHSFNLDLERARSIPEPIDLWSHDEIFALLRVRSSMDSSWFPQDFTWEQVSRRLEELGFKRSADKCKEKFEEESRAYFSNINSYKNSNNTYRSFSELEVICHGDETQTTPPLVESLSGEEKSHQCMENPNEGEEEEEEEEQMDRIMEERSEKGVMGTAQENEDSLADQREEESKRIKKDKKKKKQRKFEILKGFCEGFVKKMMSKQEELHNKLLEDMMKRDEEKFAVEESRKKQEMERIYKEIQNWEHEQAISGERQTSIIEFLEKFTFGTHQNQCFGGKKNIEELQGLLPSISKTRSSKMPTTSHDPNPNSGTTQSNPDFPSSSPETLAPQTPTNVTKAQTASSAGLVGNNPNAIISSPDTTNSPELTLNSAKRRSSQDRSAVSIIPTDDYGKRWPKDEVLALINVRCSFFNEEDNKEGANNSNKVPLWERISQKMSEMGYKRSAKRCKEKWENINKYFRKTKDTNRKRSVDSRTCPYFHQLSSLYNNQGGNKVMTVPEISSSSPGNHSSPLENCRQEHTQAMHVASAVEEGSQKVLSFSPRNNENFSKIFPMPSI